MCFFALVLGGGAEERWRTQVRPLVYGTAHIHRGVCPRARGLSTHGARHGGGQEVPVSCESCWLVVVWGGGSIDSVCFDSTFFLLIRLLIIHLVFHLPCKMSTVLTSTQAELSEVQVMSSGLL